MADSIERYKYRYMYEKMSSDSTGGADGTSPGEGHLTQIGWTGVDRYFTDLLAPADPVLEAGAGGERGGRTSTGSA
jgi:hypothetical protein